MRAIAAAPWALGREGKGGRSSAPRVYVYVKLRFNACLRTEPEKAHRLALNHSVSPIFVHFQHFGVKIVLFVSSVVENYAPMKYRKNARIFNALVIFSDFQVISAF